MKRIFPILFALLFGFNLAAQSKGPKELNLSFENVFNQFNGRSGTFDLVIPEYDPNKKFHLQENEVLGENIKRDNPGLKTFFVLEKEAIVGSATFYENGFWIDYSFNGKMVSIYPDFEKGARGACKIEEERFPMKFGMCGVKHTAEDFRKEHSELNSTSRSVPVTKREYRIAIVATGEFFNLNGNTAADAQAVIASSVNGISAIYTKQFGIFFKLVNSFAHPNPATDPFIPDETGGPGRTIQANTQVPLQFSPSSYDIGHVLHKSVSGDNWSGGGLAQLNSVCRSGKAAGWSGSFSNSGFDWFSLFGHEIGHQFGMTHTFNGTGDNCTDNIAEDTAVEIGSGTTIMSYNGLCQANNNVPSNGESDNYFHYISAQNMYNFIQNQISTCVAETPLANNLPVVKSNPCNVPVFRLPKNTPYYLKGTATDQDNDQLFYAWEQYDEDGAGVTPTQGQVGSSASNRKNSPLMKNFPPSTNNERYFPDIATVSRGNNSDPFQVLANTDRDIKMAFSARDNKATGGGTTYETFTLKVDATGPLTIDYPNSAVTFMSAETVEVKWNPNGSDNLCNKANIYLSIDGGITFPILLAKDVDYKSDSIDITLPGNINTTTARIKVSCEDYDCFKFYDISNANFTIQSTCNAPQSIICPSVNLKYDKGAPELDLTLKNAYGSTVAGFNKRITTSSPQGQTPVFNNASTGCLVKGTSTRHISTLISVTKSGVYNFSVDVDFGDGFGFVSIIDDALYNPNNGCSGFIASSGVDPSSGMGVSARSSMSATLNECSNYRLLFFNYGTLPKSTVITGVSGPGLVVEASLPVTDFNYTYVAVRKSNNLVAAVSATSDFRTLSPGTYLIYGLSYKANGITPPNITNYENYIGKDFSAFYIAGDCYMSSNNFFELVIEGQCALEGATLGTQSACDPMDNSFLQPITLTFNNNPGGKVNVGGQLFDITTSPQTINYKGLSNGLTNNVDVFFASDPDCKYSLSITSPNNCCPIESGISNDVRGCEGQPLSLKANPDLGIYNWFNESNVLIGSSNEVTLTTAGQYKLVITSLTGCEKSQNIKVSFEPTPTVALPADVTICDGVKFQINATTNASFMEWFRNDTLVQSGPNKILEVTKKGTYKIKAGNSALCQVEDIILVNSKPSPKPALGIDKDICAGNSTTLSTTENGTITWFFNNVAIAGQIGKSITVDEEGIYKIIIKASNDCEGQDEINVNVFDLPTIEAGPNQEFCDGKDVTISANSTTQNFFWQKDGQAFPQTELTFNSNQAGKYKLIAQNTIGCQIADSFTVIKNPLPSIDLPATQTVCIGSSTTLSGPTTAGLTYKWFRNGLPIPGGATINVDMPGLYLLEITNTKNCSNSDTSRISFVPGPSVSFNSTTIEFCEGESFDLIATTPATNIEWLKNGTKINGANSKTLKITEAGKYTIGVTSGTGCKAVLDATAIVNPKLNLIVNDTAACEGEVITLTSNVNAQKYTWSLNGNPLGSSKTFKPTSPGTYKLEVETNKGCKSSDEAVVVFSTRPNIVIPPNGQYCKGEELNITASSNGTAFKWLRNNVAIANATSKDLKINTPGTYIIEASFNGACPKRDTIVIAERPLPTIALGIDKVLCPNDSITLDAANTGSKYLWSTGDTTKTIKIKNTGVASVKDIKVTVTNSFNCKATDEIKVTSQAKIKISLETSAAGVCGGDSITLTVKGGSKYQWSGPAGTFIQLSPDKIKAFPSVNTIYKVSASDDCPSNNDTLSREVKIFALPKVSAGNDTSSILGKTIKLKASGGASYSWKSDPTLLKGGNTSTPEVGPIVPTTYTVTIKDINGCIQTDSVLVSIIEDPLKLIQPIDMVTPNGDGKNDVLEFEGLQAFPTNNLIIYNRWGNIVFEKRGYQSDSERFDGTRNGEELPADTYYYVLTFENNTFKQAITILRDKN